MTASVMWFRRDLRTGDNPALREAVKAGDATLALFVLDPTLLGPAGDIPRVAFLFECLRALDEQLGGNLVIRTGDPVKVVPAVAEEAGAGEVFCTEDFGPYGRRRDDLIEKALVDSGKSLHRVDSNYAVEPGAVLKNDGTPFQVFTPFSRAWASHGWAGPQQAPRNAAYLSMKSDGIPATPAVDAQLPKAGEAAAKKRLQAFLDTRVTQYKALRDEPAAGATSRLSPYLKYGCLHPRQALAHLGSSAGETTFRNELCWREFYADVLFHRPDTLDHAYQPKMAAMRVDSGKTADERFEAWAAGRTGFPIVDAGMRQLLGEAWMHNRVRMIVASFLIKDLHLDWGRGADHFKRHLCDWDVASNTHGWQWVAGTGTDAAPYFRVFNPVTQGKKFDSAGDYIRKWVPELRDVDSKYIHEPWKAPGGLPSGYPEPMVDHDVERRESLARYNELRNV